MIGRKNLQSICGKMPVSLVLSGSSSLKLTAAKVAEETLQLHGGYGYIGDYTIGRVYRDSKIVEIYEGTKEIEKIIIARHLLGKY
ncbi:MAG: acyl-CoA/acyl-ACP dehydrogenase [Deltaproteobacteria bacterium]|nr:acyl-CoA/acyl-ACP dehydrogenase [Deltaproteobacteria bacterium]